MLFTFIIVLIIFIIFIYLLVECTSNTKIKQKSQDGFDFILNYVSVYVWSFLRYNQVTDIKARAGGISLVAIAMALAGRALTRRALVGPPGPL